MNEGLSFRFTSSPYFCKMIFHLDERVVINHHTTYSRRIRKKSKFVKRRVKQEMKDKSVVGVGFTADGWESRGGEDYLGITGHFVDDNFELKRLTIACAHFEEQHTGNNINKVLTEEVRKVNLGPLVAKTIVTDEASNMKKGRRMEGISNLNCGNHKLQNSIKDAKNECKEANEMFECATRLSNFGRKSPYFHNKMKKYCKKYNHNFSRLRGVSKVRWNCTHKMLQRLLKHKQCIQNMEENNDVGDIPILEVAQWRLLKEIVHILSPLESTTKVWEMETEPTIQLVGEEVYNLVTKLKETIEEKENSIEYREDNPHEVGLKFARSLLKSIQNRFQKFGLVDDLPAWASLLDPRQKNLLLDEVDLAERTKRSLEEFISRLVSDVEIEEQVQVEHKEKNDGKEDTPIQKLKRKKGLDRSENFTEMEVSAVEKELAIYHKMKEPDATISILQFWKRNREVLPLLSKAAQAILAVPCASSSVERVFSIAGLTVGVRRRSLVPKSVETIVIMCSNKG